MWGFKLREVNPGPTRRIEYKFSAAESKNIVAAAEAKGLTLNLISAFYLHFVTSGR